jgi:hypothetical protein
MLLWLILAAFITHKIIKAIDESKVISGITKFIPWIVLLPVLTILLIFISSFVIALLSGQI